MGGGGAVRGSARARVSIDLCLAGLVFEPGVWVNLNGGGGVGRSVKRVILDRVVGPPGVPRAGCTRGRPECGKGHKTYSRHAPLSGVGR